LRATFSLLTALKFVQSVVDDKNGLIVHAEPVNDTSDINQFAKQIERAHAVLKKPCKTACADAGYADTDELEKIDAKGVKVIVPSQLQALHKGEKPFSKSEFIYDGYNNCYYCPKGNTLRHVSTEKKTGRSPNNRQTTLLQLSALGRMYHRQKWPKACPFT